VIRSSRVETGKHLAAASLECRLKISRPVNELRRIGYAQILDFAALQALRRCRRCTDRQQRRESDDGWTTRVTKPR
jgi:hypothetical protein